MGLSGIMRSKQYERTPSSSVQTRESIPPWYAPSLPYSTASSAGMGVQHPLPQQQNPFSSPSYGAPSTPVTPIGVSYLQSLPQTPMLLQQSQSRVSVRTGYLEEQRSPSIKHEAHSVPSINTVWDMNKNQAVQTYSTTTTPITGTEEIASGTDVDILMKAIQTKGPVDAQPQPTSSIDQSKSVVGYSPPDIFRTAPRSFADTSHVDYQKLTRVDSQDDHSSSKKKHHCNIPGCNKSFPQKTHLEIHIRKHTGQKPYLCKCCNRLFSQSGNLKTHERGHTGERPFSCETCGKRFAQKGNVRAHKVVHSRDKPYSCKLEDCGKQFTQLGNLKSHQNKFHSHALRILTSRFASMQNDNHLSADDKELFEYFSKLYRNSNKGIKGRGKGRKVGSLSNSPSSDRGFGSRGFQQIDMPIAQLHGLPVGTRESSHHSTATGFEMFDEEGSVGGSQWTGSTAGSLYAVEAPNDNYDADGRHLAFGDRMY